MNAAGTASAGSDGVGPFPYVKQTTPTYGDQPYAPPLVEATTPTYGNQPYPVANLAADPAAHDLQQQVLIAEEQPRSDAYSYEVPAVRQAGYPLQPGGRKASPAAGRSSQLACMLCACCLPGSKLWLAPLILGRCHVHSQVGPPCCLSALPLPINHRLQEVLLSFC